MKNINRTLKKYQPTIQTLGIITAIVVLILTFHTSILTKKSIELSYQQEYNKQLPIWDWLINDSSSVVELKSFNPDIKIQYADAYFSKEVFGDSPDWPLTPPKFKLHLTMFKFHMENWFEKQHEYNPEYSVVAQRNHFPIGVEINYIQYGTTRTVKGIFVLEFDIVRTSERPKAFLKGVLFDHYLTEKQDLKKEIESLTKEIIKATPKNHK